MKRNTYKKSQRILLRSEFLSLFQKKKGFSIPNKTPPYPILDWAYSSFRNPRIGITVTKKQGGSVERNRFKRIAREAFRKSKLASCSIGVDIQIRVRGSLILEKTPTVFSHAIEFSDLEYLFQQFALYLLSRYAREKCPN